MAIYHINSCEHFQRREVPTTFIVLISNQLSWMITCNVQLVWIGIYQVEEGDPRWICRSENKNHGDPSSHCNPDERSEASRIWQIAFTMRGSQRARLNRGCYVIVASAPPGGRGNRVRACRTASMSQSMLSRKSSELPHHVDCNYIVLNIDCGSGLVIFKGNWHNHRIIIDINIIINVIIINATGCFF